MGSGTIEVETSFFEGDPYYSQLSTDEQREAREMFEWARQINSKNGVDADDLERRRKAAAQGITILGRL